MARFTPLLLVLLALVPLYNALDCRKFSFAPACRGIMLKRSGAHAIVDQSPPMTGSAKDQKVELMEDLIQALEDYASIAKSDCVSISWLRDRFIKVRNDITMN